MSQDATSRYDPTAPPFRPAWQVEVDLHLHTTASDGLLTPTQLIQRIAATTLRVIAITDHDSTNGIDEAMAAAESHEKLTVIPGIEFGSEVGESEVHMLGYFIDYRSQSLQDALRRFREQRVEAARQTVLKLATLGVHISWERVQELAGGAVGRPHVARAMVEAQYVANVPEAFDRYLGNGGPARVPRPKFTPLQAVELVHSVGGVAAIAHPRTVADLNPIVEELAAAGLAGIEVYAEKYGSSQHHEYKALAEHYDLVECGGSDYHAFGNTNEVTPGTSGPPRTTARLLYERARLRHGDSVGYVPKRPL